MVKIGTRQWLTERINVIEGNIRKNIVRRIGTALDDHEGTVKDIFGDAEEQDLIKGLVVEIDKKNTDIVQFKTGDSFIKLEIKEDRKGIPRITRIKYGGNSATLIADRVSAFLNRTIIREKDKKKKKRADHIRRVDTSKAEWDIREDRFR